MGHATDLNRQRMNKRIEQMKFLLENLNMPEINTDGYGKMEVEENGYCPSGITMAIINFMSHASEYNYTTISSFMSKIQSYLPQELRITTYKSQRKNKNESPLWNPRNINESKPDDIGEETKEWLDKMVIWFTDMKAKCLNDLTFKYLTQGKLQYIEVMKRRWKDTYSEKVEQSVQAAVKSNNQINLIFEDA